MSSPSHDSRWSGAAIAELGLSLVGWSPFGAGSVLAIDLELRANRQIRLAASCRSPGLSFPPTENALFLGLPALSMLVLVAAVRRLRNASLRKAVAAGLGLADVASVVVAFLITLDLGFSYC